MVALEVSAATAEIKHWLPKMYSFSLDENESKMKISNLLQSFSWYNVVDFME